MNKQKYDPADLKDFDGMLVDVAFYPSMTRKEYDALDALSHLKMKPILDVSPAYAKWKWENVEGTFDIAAHKWQKKVGGTPALQYGIAAHIWVLQVDKFKELVAIKPEGIDRRTNVGKAAWSEFVAASEGKVIIDQDDWDNLSGLRSAALYNIEHKQCVRRTNELSITATFEVTGGRFKGSKVPLKAQLDTLIELEKSMLIRDLEIVADISDIKRASFEGGWAIKSALYTDLVSELTRQQVSFEYVPVEREAPWTSRKFIVSPEMLLKGRAQYTSAIHRQLWWLANGKPCTEDFLGTEVLED